MAMTMNLFGHAIRVGDMTSLSPGVAPRAAIARKPLRRVSVAVLLVLCGVVGMSACKTFEVGGSTPTPSSPLAATAASTRAPHTPAGQGTHDVGLQRMVGSFAQPRTGSRMQGLTAPTF